MYTDEYRVIFKLILDVNNTLCDPRYQIDISYRIDISYKLDKCESVVKHISSEQPSEQFNKELEQCFECKYYCEITEFSMKVLRPKVMKIFMTDKCPICYDDMNECVLFDCGHTICSRCTKNLQNEKCPICMQTITVKHTVHFQMIDV